MKYHAVFGLASFEWRRERVTARFDDFQTHQVSGFYGPIRDNAGHAWTVGWTHELGDERQLTAEWIRASSQFPPRASHGVPVALTESQVQLAVRYRFRLAL